MSGTRPAEWASLNPFADDRRNVGANQASDHAGALGEFIPQRPHPANRCHRSATAGLSVGLVSALRDDLDLANVVKEREPERAYLTRYQGSSV